jgi:hypothetical protein
MKYDDLYEKLDSETNNINCELKEDHNKLLVSEEFSRKFFESRTVNESHIFNQIPNNVEEISPDLIKGANCLK